MKQLPLGAEAAGDDAAAVMLQQRPHHHYSSSAISLGGQTMAAVGQHKT